MFVFFIIVLSEVGLFKFECSIKNYILLLKPVYNVIDCLDNGPRMLVLASRAPFIAYPYAMFNDNVRANPNFVFNLYGDYIFAWKETNLYKSM